ncbi:hypothetical protein [Rhodoferax sp.]|uniref:hypothetical protein n=1 Tax=Rhodoferax sp. TaxID=50421 RepID=UPI0026392A79|nr:hypothetical protein [Rhodoferax sp.]MDD3938037.1 hypothetical protein [Rhodoferax sp.]
MDVSDTATLREEQERERALHRTRAEGPRPTGLCLFCGLVVTHGRRWCDAECRDEWQAWSDHARQDRKA